jgi:hypothetical protein
MLLQTCSFRYTSPLETCSLNMHFVFFRHRFSLSPFQVTSSFDTSYATFFGLRRQPTHYTLVPPLSLITTAAHDYLYLHALYCSRFGSIPFFDLCFHISLRIDLPACHYLLCRLSSRIPTLVYYLFIYLTQALCIGLSSFV